MLKTPALEAEYAHDDRSPLQLYDCLIPKLREHRMLQIRPEYASTNLINDLKMQKEVFELELKVMKNRGLIPKLRGKIEHYKIRLDQLKHEASEIKSVTQAVQLDHRLDAENIIENYE